MFELTFASMAAPSLIQGVLMFTGGMLLGLAFQRIAAHRRDRS